jgi:hypothetical protein
MSGVAEPLIDDQEFLDDLQQLVNEPPRAVDPHARSPLDAFDALLGADNADGLSGRDAETPGRVAAMWPDHLEEQQHRAARGAVERPETPLPFAVSALIVGVCAATGAGMAALVFHDRVAHLLELLTR